MVGFPLEIGCFLGIGVCNFSDFCPEPSALNFFCRTLFSNFSGAVSLPSSFSSISSNFSYASSTNPWAFTRFRTLAATKKELEFISPSSTAMSFTALRSEYISSSSLYFTSSTPMSFTASKSDFLSCLRFPSSDAQSWNAGGSKSSFQSSLRST